MEGQYNAPNTVSKVEAKLPDGGFIGYCDYEPGHIRRGHWEHIVNSHPLAFSVYTTDGQGFSVDLIDGSLNAGGEIFSVQGVPPTPLRLIYYKHMESDTGGYEPVCAYFVVGWQTTFEGRNVRLGLKVFPRERTFEVTQEI